MPFLRDEARKLAEPTRESGVISVFFEFGNTTLIRALPYKETRGTEHKWTIQTKRASGSSAANKYGDKTASGGAEKRNVEVETAMYRRNAKTAIAGDVELSEFNRQRGVDEYDETQQLAFDYGHDLINGMGVAHRMHGANFYLTLYNGVQAQDGTKSQIISMGQSTFPTWEDRIFWNTDDGSPAGSNPAPGTDKRQDLSLPVLTDLITRHGDGQPYECAFTNRETRNALYHLIAAGSGGSMVDTYFSFMYNQEVLRYQGVEFIRNDFVGCERTGTSPYGISGSSAQKTLTVQTPSNTDDDEWSGFQALDVGRQIVIAPGTGDEETKTIVNVNNLREIEVESNLSNSHSDVDFKIKKDNQIICTRMHEMNGWCGVYSDMGQYNEGGSTMMYGGAQPIAGIAVRDVGVLQTGGRHAITQFDMLHTTKGASPWTFAALAGFTLPNTQ